MASVCVLKTTFRKGNGDSLVFSHRYADPEVSASNVKAFMQSMVTNGDIFENVPVSISSAKKVTTEETAIDLS